MALSCKVTVKPDAGKLVKSVKRPTALLAAEKIEETNAYSTLMAEKKEFPEGMTLTNSYYYAWSGGIYRGGYGCAAFAFKLSDEIFGTDLATMHRLQNNLTQDERIEQLKNVRIGDIIRTDNNTHSVIVIYKNSGGITVAEGNYCKKVHWGRFIPWDSVDLKTATNYITRYKD